MAQSRSKRAAPIKAPATKEPAQPRRALGRGLSSLIPPPAATTTTGNGYRTLPVERLHPNAKQPRKVFDEGALAELTHSIRTQGVLQPILVRRHGDDYEIVAGERRWRAATRAGLREVPTIVKDLSDSHALQVALIENIQRRDLDPLEEAEAYQRLIQEHKLTHEELAEAVGKNRVTITNSMRLLKLPPEIMQLVAEGKLSAGHVRPLMTLPDAKTMIRLAEEFVGRKVSVRDAEQRVKQAAMQLNKGRASDKRTAAGNAKDGSAAACAHIAQQLQGYLNTKVKVASQGKKGTIEIQFHSFEALDDILDKMMHS